MKMLFPVILLCGLFPACNQPSEISNVPKKSLLTISENLNPVQIFTLAQNKDTIITGRLGTKIFISANSFEFEEGGIPSGNIALHLKEIYSHSEMILNNLTTATNGDLLETSGMLNILATSDGKSIKLKAGSPIKIQFKKTAEAPFMRSYLGERDSIGINWQLDNENVMDTIFYTVKKESYIIDNEEDIPGEAYYIEVISYGIVGKDTFEISRSKSGGESDIAYENVPYYSLHSTKLGWINCDYFIDADDVMDFNVTKTDSIKTQIYLIFKDINSIMGPTDWDDKTYFFRNIPKGSEVMVLSIGNKDDEFYFASSTKKLNEDNEVIQLNYNKTTLEEIEKNIQSLDK